ncbi:MAG: hypothetical protein AAF547_19110 [Actinomycetota bacterium]
MADRVQVLDEPIDGERALLATGAATSSLIPPDHGPIVVEQCCQGPEVVPHTGPAVTEDQRETGLRTRLLDPQRNTVANVNHSHSTKHGMTDIRSSRSPANIEREATRSR